MHYCKQEERYREKFNPRFKTICPCCNHQWEITKNHLSLRQEEGIVIYFTCPNCKFTKEAKEEGS